MATAKKKPSGSTKIAKQRPSFTPDNVQRLMAWLKGLKAKPDIIIKGTPKPDWLKGSFVAPNTDVALSGLVEVLKLGGSFKPVRLFPKGIPVINSVKVQFEARAK